MCAAMKPYGKVGKLGKCPVAPLNCIHQEKWSYPFWTTHLSPLHSAPVHRLVNQRLFVVAGLTSFLRLRYLPKKDRNRKSFAKKSTVSQMVWNHEVITITHCFVSCKATRCHYTIKTGHRAREDGRWRMGSELP